MNLLFLLDALLWVALPGLIAAAIIGYYLVRLVFFMFFTRGR